MRGGKVIDSKLIDSSLWIDYAIKGAHKEIIESEDSISTCSLSLFEIKKKFIKDKLSNDKINGIISFIKQQSTIIGIEEGIIEKAAETSVKNNLGSIDAMIYQTALMKEMTFITLDNDFRGLPNVIVLDKE